MIQGLDHIQLAMPPGGEPRARAFYGELLGLREIPKPPELAKRGGLWFELPDGRGLHLGVEEPFVPAKKAHPAFRVLTLDLLAERLSQAKAPVKWSHEVPDVRRFHGEDPFGNRLEFQEHPSEHKLTEDEVLAVLYALEKEEVTIPTAQRLRAEEAPSGGVPFVCSNGWCFVIFSDAFEWDYILRVTAPDGRWLEFADMMGEPGQPSPMPRLADYRPPAQIGLDVWGLLGESEEVGEARRVR
ncbi:hypothetical protein VZQ01_16480 [Myxococcus faecalis]|jgi:catechol 2,3-dioxygenase-like lactoylglutathione lyase family enzyme|uniref:hypothetical protein n=1 Tax=Myxococcus faecalis TaxID=3115646 RepID=UPI0024CB7486|nr:hypothetical protein MFMH1_06170 [Myxococcus sp. MH1]